MQAGEPSLKIINSRRTHESTTSISSIDVLKGLHTCGFIDGWRQVHQPCYATALELFLGRLGDAGRDMKGGARPGSGRKPTLIDARRALVLREQGESMREIAERFGVSLQVIKYFFKKRRKQNGNDPRSQGKEGSQATA